MSCISETADLLSTCLLLCIHTQEITCTLLTRCSPQSSLLTSLHPTHVPVSFPPSFFSLHWAFEALSLFIPPPLLPALKGWSVTELVASFIGVSQQPGDKGHLKCHSVFIFCLCADANAWKESDIQSSALKSWNTVEDGWRQTRRMRTIQRRRRRMGVRFVIDYARSKFGFWSV